VLKEKDTIAAIATAPGQGAIGVVRISGDNAEEVLGRVFRSAGKGISAGHFESHKMYYGSIMRNGEAIDEVMACIMFAPRTFTSEHTVEIYAHGGMFVLGEVLSAVLDAGARPAEPGEFTKRAFLNGRINLSQAEAVAELISAKSCAARRVALRQLGGGLSRRITFVRDKILEWLAHIELSIDYPEHEDEARNSDEIRREAIAVIDDLRRLHETSRAGRILREGVPTVIIGRPNSGKSTLLNAILSEDRAIVHEIPGTTRDILTEHVRISDIALALSDTAGLRETSDPVEKIGIEKTRFAIQSAQLVLYVADATKGLTREDVTNLKSLNADAQLIILMNKSDLLNNPPKSTEILDFEHTLLKISAKTGEGLENLFAHIKKIVSESTGEGDEPDIVTSERHRVLLEAAINDVQKARHELETGVPEDLVSVTLRAAYIKLGEILGVEIGDDIVDRIFEEFCLGK